MASRGDQPQGGQTAPEQPLPTQSGAPPWPGPGPDTDWWHGGRTDPSDALAPVSPAPAQPATPARSVARRVRPPRPTRRPGSGLVALVGVGLVALFFAWFGAEPLWLSLGHGTAGTATVQSCRVHGIARACADFSAGGDAFVAGKVTLLGAGDVAPGARVPARMVSATGSTAYAGGTTMRWAPSLLAILLCGFAIAWLTGAYRLPGRRARLGALALSLAGPLLLAAGMLAATW